MDNPAGLLDRRYMRLRSGMAQQGARGREWRPGWPFMARSGLLHVATGPCARPFTDRPTSSRAELPDHLWPAAVLRSIEKWGGLDPHFSMRPGKQTTCGLCPGPAGRPLEGSRSPITDRGRPLGLNAGASSAGQLQGGGGLPPPTPTAGPGSGSAHGTSGRSRDMALRAMAGTEPRRRP